MVSDFHIVADAPESSAIRLHATAAARKVVAYIAAFSPRIDAVMFTGDLTESRASRTAAGRCADGRFRNGSERWMS